MSEVNKAVKFQGFGLQCVFLMENKNFCCLGMCCFVVLEQDAYAEIEVIMMLIH